MHSSVESSPSKGDASSLAPSLRANKLLDAFLVYKRQKVGTGAIWAVLQFWIKHVIHGFRCFSKVSLSLELLSIHPCFWDSSLLNTIWSDTRYIVDTSIFTANCNLRGTFWPILRSVFASLVDVFQALRWFQRGRGFKRRRRCCCIPNFPNPQLGFSSCIREKVAMQLFSFSPNSLTLPFFPVPLLTQFHLIFLLLNFNFQCCLEFYSTVKEILAQSRFPTLWTHIVRPFEV